MKRVFLHLIVGLLTFSLGSFLFLASDYYNTMVVRGEAEKREKADYPLTQGLSSSDIEMRMRLLCCSDKPEVSCVYALVRDEAWPEACQEYRRLLSKLK
jgi:hypothetical protein